MEKVKTYKCQSLSLNLIITTVVYGGIVLIGMINTRGDISQSSLVKIILGAVLLLLLTIWSTVVIVLNDKYLIVRYPFKFFYTRKYIFLLDDIKMITIRDPKDGRFSLRKIEIQYSINGTTKISVLGNNLKDSKIQKLIDDLRGKGINVKVIAEDLK